MKTTIELPDELLSRAKAVAAERRTTLKAMFEHALRRELNETGTASVEARIWKTNEFGFPVLKPGGVKVTSEQVYELLEDEG